MHYQDFVIEASGLQPDGTFHIEIPRSPAGGLDEKIVSVYDASSVKPLVAKVEDADRRLAMRLDDLIVLGKALAAMLFPGKIERVLRESLGLVEAHREGLRLRLEIRDPRLAALPWEYVYWQRVGGEPSLSGFLVRNPHLSIVRYTRMQRPGPRQDARVSRLNVFAVFAEPEDMGELDQAKVRRHLEEAFDGEAGIALQIEESLTRHELQTTMQRGQYDIFTFSGHGGFITPEDLVAFERGLQHGTRAKHDAPAPQVAQAATMAASQADFSSFLSSVNAQVAQRRAEDTEPTAPEEALPPDDPAAQADFSSFLSSVNAQLAGAGAEDTEPTAEQAAGHTERSSEASSRKCVRFSRGKQSHRA